ncbi:argininosuccinate lyase [[Eubacterium] cellulosolvens]
MVGQNIYRSRLTQSYDKRAASFVSSLSEDRWIILEDIKGTEAHDIMLAEQKIINRRELKLILNALEEIRHEAHTGKIRLVGKSEDIHEYIESRVIEKIGVEVGGKIHTGRSRNDQIAVDIRMKVRKEINCVSRHILSLIRALHERAKEETETLALLYTHTQQAQIGVYAHYLNSYIDMLLRDFHRLDDCYKRVNMNPLGACAVGGTRFPIDRYRTTMLLGFDSLIYNSLDAVSSRDCVLETVGDLSILMANLGRIAEDVILWSSEEFGYLEVADEFSSVSSAMPHKKNPCAVELVRGKVGQIYGTLLNLLTIIKGLPSGYNRDLQVMKKPLMESFTIIADSLQILNGVFKTLKVNKTKLRASVEKSYVTALDLAELLSVESDLSFREAHTLVGKIVLKFIKEKKNLKDVDAATIRTLSQQYLRKDTQIDDRLLVQALKLETCLAGKLSQGSPAPSEIKKLFILHLREISQCEKILQTREKKLQKAQEKLTSLINKYTRE